MLTSKAKQKTIEKHRIHEKDTGSTEVQIALLTQEIKRLTEHLKEHPKDNHSRRGLLKMVSKRRSLLGHLAGEDEKSHQALIKKLGLARSSRQTPAQQNDK